MKNKVSKYWQYLAEIYEKLQQLGASIMLHEVDRKDLPVILDDMADDCLTYFRQNEISKPEYNRSIKLINCYRNL